MGFTGSNPVSLKLKIKYDMQSQDIKDRLDNIENTDYQLKVIKRTRPEIRTGDIFVLSPRENVYFYGKVLKTDIQPLDNNPFTKGKQTVFIHKCKSNRISLEDFRPNYDDLLINPAIVDRSYWTRGYFYNIGNQSLTEIEQNLDYGFYKSGIPTIRDGWFCNEEGEPLDRQPQIIASYGITTIIGIAIQVEREIIMDSSLIEIDS